MQTQDSIMRHALAKSGQYSGILWRSTLKTRKGISDTVEKEVRTVCRIGLEHDSRAIVSGARESGELPSINGGLPWGEWLVYPYIITHKGKLYVRLYPVRNRRPRVRYLLNGEASSLEAISSLVLASELPKPHKLTDCYTVTLSNILRLK